VPVANADYWGPKIARNVERDRRNDALLSEMGWTVVRIWEHEPVEEGVARIAASLAQARSMERRQAGSGTPAMR